MLSSEMNPNSIQPADAHFQDGTSKLSKMNPNSTIQPANEDVPYDFQDKDEDEDEDIPEPYDYQDVDEFRVWVMEDDWEEVIKRYEEHVFFHRIRIKGRGTALHVAVSNADEDSVKRLVDAIERHDDKYSGLTIKTEKRGDTPLHLAAYRGFTSMCECIIGKNGERKDLIRDRNAKGETPLFSAVLVRNEETFVYLSQFFPYDISIAINNNNGATILHVAIQRELFGMACIIMCLYPVFGSIEDKDGVSPLEILATRTSAFESSINQLSWWKQILYNCVSVKVWDAKTRIKLYAKKFKFEDVEDKEKDHQSEFSIPIFNVDESYKTSKVRHFLARVDFTSCAKILCYNIAKFVFRWSILSPLDIEEIRRVKEKHITGGKLLEAFMQDPYESYMVDSGVNPYGDGEYDEEIKEKVMNLEIIGRVLKHKREEKDSKNKPTQEREGNQEMEDSTKNVEKDTTFLAIAKSGVVEIMEELNSKVKASDKKGLLLVAMKDIASELSPKKSGTDDTAYLRAAKHGITEIMRELESKLKSVIHETNSNNENALLIAVKYRQPQVVEGLWKRLSMQTFQSLSLEVDNNENTILHMAAYPSIDNENSWKVSGAAMQMMWDIKWYKYIKGLEPEHFNHRSNKDGKTPSEIFKEGRKELLQNSTQWLIETTQSCSAVAAIVAGISFATLSSVPGGNKETGKSSSEEHTALEGFAISSLIGVYFSVTALILFLSILIDRKQIEDFDRKLPLKLLIGLSSVFVSIVAEFVSFCTGHFLTLSDKYTRGGILFYIYVLICLPITLYAMVQFRLYVDLVKVLCKKVPPPSIKGVKL